MNLAREARRNRLKVIEGALSVENQLGAVIEHYFFGSSHERRAVFESLILNSDWCSFAEKRKLITHIINEQKLPEGREKEEFDKLMRKVMSARNAFAHGKISSDDKRVWLSFFSGTPQKQELTDEYLTEIETLLRVAFRQDVWTRSEDWSNKTRRKHQRSLTTGGANRRFEFQKCGQLFIRVHSEAFSVTAMRISNPDRSPVGIHG